MALLKDGEIHKYPEYLEFLNISFYFHKKKIRWVCRYIILIVKTKKKLNKTVKIKISEIKPQATKKNCKKIRNSHNYRRYFKNKKKI